jgi:hypothetical protein
MAQSPWLPLPMLLPSCKLLSLFTQINVLTKAQTSPLSNFREFQLLCKETKCRFLWLFEIAGEGERVSASRG